jgi:UDP-4-amino-4,6-dideoxy-N-acetyl-beta-L-altrosamine transaminase
MNPIPYGKHFIDDSDIEAVIKVLKTGSLTQGDAVTDFEKNFCEYVNSKYSISVNSGTGALHIAVKALGLKAGDKVFCTPITFVADANCVMYEGGIVEFIDIDPRTYILDLDKLEAKLSISKEGEYKGLIIVSYAGYPIDLERVRNIADKYKLWVIDDCCHALGAEYQDSIGVWHKVGNGVHTDISTFSFHPVKHITSAEGGAVTTRDKKLFQRLQLYRSHGITKDLSLFVNKADGPWDYEMQELGYNYRLPDLNCALVNSQLTRADKYLEKRRAIADRYNLELQGIEELVTPFAHEKIRHAYHLYVIRSNKRKELYNFLMSKKIFTQVHYKPIYLQPYYQNLNHWPSCVEAEKFYNECLSLPMFPTLTFEEQTYVINCIKDFYCKD